MMLQLSARHSKATDQDKRLQSREKVFELMIVEQNLILAYLNGGATLDADIRLRRETSSSPYASSTTTSIIHHSARRTAPPLLCSSTSDQAPGGIKIHTDIMTSSPAAMLGQASSSGGSSAADRPGTTTNEAELPVAEAATPSQSRERPADAVTPQFLRANSALISADGLAALARFSKLPLELRLAVWGLCIWRRFVQWSAGGGALPVISAASQESSKEGWESEQVCDARSSETQDKRVIFLDVDNNLVHCNSAYPRSSIPRAHDDRTGPMLAPFARAPPAVLSYDKETRDFKFTPAWGADPRIIALPFEEALLIASHVLADTLETGVHRTFFNILASAFPELEKFILTEDSVCPGSGDEVEIFSMEE
ncbi:hypothetical protein JHW43_007124 [Diplocarpon mali]|nr:hypothetical protein JHW43_007124 [Diplocarpon mali]